LIAAGVAAYHRRPRAEAVLALLDGRNRCGGLLMAELDQPLGAWLGRIGALTRPRLRWRGQRTFAVTAAAGLFLLGSFLVPDRFTTFAPPRAARYQ
jgi:hypothetical protein